MAAGFFGFLAAGILATAMLVITSRMGRRPDRATVITALVVMIVTSATIIQTRALDSMFDGYFSFKRRRRCMRWRRHFPILTARFFSER